MTGTTARHGALALLNGVLGDGAMLGQLLADPGPLSTLPGPERARAQRLALSVLRQIDPADRALSPHLRRAPPLAIQNILRLAVIELASGAAPHGVVNAAVGLAKSGKKTQHQSGLVNAVLRALPENPLAGQPPQHLPRWLRQPLVHVYGREAVALMEAVQSRPAPIDLTLRANAQAPDGTLLPNGSLRLTDPSQISALPGYTQGGWWVQDVAASMAVPLLAPQPGEKVLDLCAAPGGKTLQLAASGADVTSVDISAPRMARVAENLTRCGLTATLITTDALHWQPETKFDAILLDAPCSASGTIRRHPDLPFVKSDADLPDLVALQAQLIDHALTLLMPTGRLVFCTCSLLPQEGEGQLTATLARHPHLEAQRPDLLGIDQSWITQENGLRLRPDYWADLGGMDGFFLARLAPKVR
ncbi:MAG: RsmB/NOP family class I SAM-dependent RNA methyltransferase [Paracoccaceae bacterium]